MPVCPRCGFERFDENDCPQCASSRRRRPAGPLAALLAPLLICASAWLYLAAAPGAASIDPSPRNASAPRPAMPRPAALPALTQAIDPPLPESAAPTPDSPPRLSASVPTGSEKEYIAWMLAHSDQSRPFLEKKWERAQAILGRKDIIEDYILKAFLFAPREYFARDFNRKKAYDNTAIPIGYGQTISGPHMVSHMTQSVEPARGDRILEIGTGSGYQSAVLSELSDRVYTIEIVPALFRETDQIYRRLEKRYPEYASISRKNADGYYGWIEHAPFQKIIVTAGIDHIPPPLLRQLAPGGIMVIPVGPPSGQTVLRIVKKSAPGGGFTFERSDIYRGRKVVFVPFTAPGGVRHSLDDSGKGGEK